MELVSLDLTSPDILSKLFELQKAVYPNTDKKNFQYTVGHYLHSSGQKGRIYGVLDRQKLVAANAFIGHSVQREGEISIAYQSSTSITHPNYRGQGLFSGLLALAKDELKTDGGAFIFGYPNHQSEPIFTGKLGFTSQQNRSIYFFRQPWGSRLQLAGKTLNDSEYKSRNTVKFDAREVSRWKKNVAENIIEVDSYGNFLFGHTIEKSTRFGKVKVFSIGGYEINMPYYFAPLIQQALRETGALMAQASTGDNAPLTQAARFVRRDTITEPTICFPLQWQVEAKDLNCWAGLKDVY
jgi:hypothetical protein